MKFYVTLDGETAVVERTDAGISLDGRELATDLARPDPAGPIHLRLGDAGFEFAVQPIEGGWELLHHGRTFRLDVENERAHHLAELAGEAAPGPTRSQIDAPMPGLVVKVLVEPGQHVEAGQGVLVIEAMKMENELRAEATGTVASIEVAPGQAVNRGDVLVRFEAPE